jgi:hypothetical protein
MRKYKYVKIDKFGAKQKSLALDKGDYMHKILETFYKLKQHKEDGIVTKTVEISRKLAIGHNLTIEDSEACINVFKEYALRYSTESWEVDFVEKPFNLHLFSTDKTEFYLEGIIDLGIKTQGKFFPVDHKTGAKLSDIAALNHQFLAYCFATNTQSIIINRVIWTKTPQFVREIKSYDKDIIEEWKEHAQDLCRLLEVAQEHNYYPQNLTSCWNCVFHDVCTSRRDSRDFKLNRDFAKVEPYDIFKK